jgi:hypothetical protein
MGGGRMTGVNNIATSMSTIDLRHVRATLEIELVAAMANGISGTQAHLGQIEMMEACANELALRNATTARTDLVYEVSHETCADGVPVELSYAVRVF